MIKEYVGTGPLAEIAAEMDALERRRREEEARAWREERDALDALDRETRELDGLAELLIHAALLAAGYRQHDRGEWRRPHERKQPTG